MSDDRRDETEKEIKHAVFLGAAGHWVVACRVSKSGEIVKSEDVAVYRDPEPPNRGAVELVEFQLRPVGPIENIPRPTVSADTQSRDFLQAALDCAWKLGLRPTPPGAPVRTRFPSPRVYTQVGPHEFTVTDEAKP